MELLESHYGASHPHVAGALNNLGNVYERTDDLERALPIRERALTIGESTLTGNSADNDGGDDS